MVTSNSIILLGYILGNFTPDDEMYKLVSYDVEGGFAIVKRTTTGNEYRVTVEQISGTE